MFLFPLKPNAIDKAISTSTFISSNLLSWQNRHRRQEVKQKNAHTKQHRLESGKSNPIIRTRWKIFCFSFVPFLWEFFSTFIVFLQWLSSNELREMNKKSKNKKSKEKTLKMKMFFLLAYYVFYTFFISAQLDAITYSLELCNSQF